ncbi:hypothetical protein [Paenibacillus sp. MBLB4367]|uniref:hypothetical protein n=1 Tax=Paenibacillus sp. MBLB4367 TaxID=3384767 RepID=UPI0039083EF7
MTEKDPKDIFALLESELELRLKPKGYVKTKHQHHPDTFGNRYSVFDGAGGLVRLIWDGQKQWFVMRVYKKRSWLMSFLQIAVRGKNDPDILRKEITLKMDEATRLASEQMINKVNEIVADVT